MTKKNFEWEKLVDHAALNTAFHHHFLQLLFRIPTKCYGEMENISTSKIKSV